MANGESTKGIFDSKSETPVAKTADAGHENVTGGMVMSTKAGLNKLLLLAMIATAATSCKYPDAAEDEAVKDFVAGPTDHPLTNIPPALKYVLEATSPAVEPPSCTTPEDCAAVGRPAPTPKVGEDPNYARPASKVKPPFNSEPFAHDPFRGIGAY